MSRRITGPLRNPVTGALMAGVRMRVETETPFASASATYPQIVADVVTDSDAQFDITLATPANGTQAYRFRLPGSGMVTLNIGTGADTTLHALIAAQIPATDPNALEAHAAVIASETVLGHVKIDGTTITIDGDGVISSAAGGAVDSVNGQTGVVVLGAADVGADPSGTAAGLVTAEASARSSADSAHAALTTGAHGGIIASTDPRLSDARTPTTHASSHASAGSDPLTLSESQITNLPADLAGKQPIDATLTALAALVIAADKLIYGTGADAFALADFTSAARTFVAATDAAGQRSALGLGSLAILSSITASLISDASANGRSLITAADYAAMRTLLGLVIGTNVQAQNANLAALAGLTLAADRSIYSTGAGALALYTLSAFARTLLDDADAATALQTLGAQLAIPDGRFAIAGTNYECVPGVVLLGNATTTFAVNTDNYAPFPVHTPITIDRLELEVTGAAAGGNTARMAIYNADTSWVPTSLVVDGGTVATDSLGLKSATVNQLLLPGRYFLAMNCSANFSLRYQLGAIPSNPIIAGTGSSSNRLFAGSRTYAAFPGTGTAIATTSAGGNGIWYFMWLRVSTP